MISFEDYFDLLEKRKDILDFFAEESKEIAENAKYLRSKKIVKLQQKDNEKARKNGLNVYYAIYNKKLKEKGVKVSAIKTIDEPANPIKRMFKKLFGIKPKEIPGEVEQLPEESKTLEIQEELEEIETTGIQVEDDDFDEELKDTGGPEYTEEELERLYPDDTIEGQMDIEELNEGNVYEKE